MKPLKRIAFVYGLFTRDGRCIYVGCTVRPDIRKKELKAGKFAPKGLQNYKWRFRRLFKCPLDDAGQMEVQTIKDYRAKGEAILNRHLAGHHGRCRTTGGALRCEENGIVFMSYGEAARYFGCGLHNISKAVNKRNGKLLIWFEEPKYTLTPVPELSWHPKES